MTDIAKPAANSACLYLDANGVLREPSLEPIPDSVYDAIAEAVPQDHRPNEILATLIPEG